jgi:hypothetical protein
VAATAVTRTLLRLVNVIAISQNPLLFTSVDHGHYGSHQTQGALPTQQPLDLRQDCERLEIYTSRSISDTVFLNSRYCTPQSSFYRWPLYHSSPASTTNTMHPDQVSPYSSFHKDVILTICAVLTTMITNAVCIPSWPLRIMIRTWALPRSPYRETTIAP